MERKNLELQCKPDFSKCMDRVYAWYDQEIIDRVPVRFSEHNASHNVDLAETLKRFPSIQAYWYDVDYQISAFRSSIRGKKLLGETFPIYYPNLGPGVYAAYYGCGLTFSEVTSWTNHNIEDLSSFELTQLKLDRGCEYWRKIEELTDAALAACPGEFMVGYTDLHPSIDCVVDWYGPEKLCMDMLMNPELVKDVVDVAWRDFGAVFRHYHDKLFAHGQLSASWMAIPFDGPMHIPSCDFSTLISPRMFAEFCLEYIQKEVKLAQYNIFHVDGPGVMKHLDALMEIPEIRAFQLVQGVAADEPILQWVPLIKRVQAAGKSLVISLKLEELEAFMGAISPKGLYLTLAADNELQPDILKKLLKWK